MATVQSDRRKVNTILKGIFEEKSPEVLLGITRQNNYLTQIVALLMAIIEMGFFLGYGRKYGFFPTEPERWIQRYSEILYLAMSLLSAAVWWYLRKTNERIAECFRCHGAVLGMYYAAFLLDAMVLTMLYRQEGDRGFVLILALVCTFGVALMHPVRMLVASVLTFFISEVFFIVNGIFDFRFAMNILEIIFFLNIIGLVKYYTICGFIDTNEKLKRYSRILERLSYQDELTKIGNRNALRREWESFVGKTISVAMFDVDNFKHYNDTYGHDMGDLVLQKVAEITKELFGEECTFRLGGDEFLIVTPLVDEDMQKYLEMLHERVHEIAAEGKVLGVSVSIGGIKAYITEPEDMIIVTKQADELLYEIKEKGKDSFLYRA